MMSPMRRVYVLFLVERPLHPQKVARRARSGLIEEQIRSSIKKKGGWTSSISQCQVSVIVGLLISQVQTGEVWIVWNEWFHPEKQILLAVLTCEFLGLKILRF